MSHKSYALHHNEVHMKSNILIFLMAFISFNAFAGVDEFPENRNYTSADKGFAKYAAPSMKGSRKIVLTFDDGPSPTETPRLLDILAKYKAKATFFMLGESITSQTLPIVERMLREGHLIAAHSWDHDNSMSQSQDAFKQSLKKTIFTLDSALKSANRTQNETYFRFPYGAYGQHSGYHHLNAMREVSTQLFGDNCINFAFWSIDTTDWLGSMTPADILQNVVANMDGGKAITHKAVKGPNGKVTYVKEHYTISNPVGGGVILMHDIHTRSVDAVEPILQWAEKNKVEVVALNTVKEYAYGDKVCKLKVQ